MKKILIITICLFLISKSAFGASLLINEIHPNPNGADKDREWIEIINLGSTNLNLENHQALLNNKTIYAFENTILPPNTPLAITTPPLKNSGGHIVLKNDQNQTIDQITYSKAPSGQSFARIENRFIWTKPSRNQQNPKAQIHQGFLIELIEKIKIPETKNPLILKLIHKEKLQILTFDSNLIKVRILRE